MLDRNPTHRGDELKMTKIKTIRTEIKTISTAQAIRLRPGLYLDPVGSQSATLALECLCHAADALYEKEMVPTIEVHPQGLVSLSYAAAPPLCKVDEMMTVLGACEGEKKHVKVGDTWCRQGIAVLNAFCSEMRIRCLRDGKSLILAYKEGEKYYESLVDQYSPRDNTHMEFQLDMSLLKGGINANLFANLIDQRGGFEVPTIISHNHRPREWTLLLPGLSPH